MKRLAEWIFHAIGLIAILYLALYAYAIFRGQKFVPGDPIQIFRNPDAPDYSLNLNDQPGRSASLRTDWRAGGLVASRALSHTQTVHESHVQIARRANSSQSTNADLQKWT